MASLDSLHSSDPWKYLEYCCQICGVSFNISRIRHRNEPFSSSWCGKDDADWTGEPLLASSYVLATDKSFESCRDCVIVARLRTPGEPTEDDNNSSTYDYESDRVPEPYERTTPPESVSEEIAQAGCSQEGAQAIGPDYPTLRESDSDTSSTLSQDSYRCFISSLGESGFSGLDKFDPQSEDLESPLFYGTEHIAGRECQCPEGYNGHRISAEEMRACTTAQFLVPKQYLYGGPWNPEPDDEEFEKGDYFLSGLTDIVPRTNSRHSPPVWPNRHGVWRVGAGNYLAHWGAAAEVSMPFHPYCLEVYKRASLRRFGKLGLEALLDWYRLENNVRDFHSFPRHPPVWRGRGITWQHHAGDEWLAANPCFIPKLPSLLDSVRISERENLELTNSPCNVFARLPTELQLEILSYLEGVDIVSVVQSSRVFRKMPQSFFRKRLLENMPWLWEGWCDLPFSFWATTTEAELQAVSSRWKAQRAELNDWRIPVLVEESQNYGVGDLEMAISTLREQSTTSRRDEMKERRPHPAYRLPDTEVDWQRLFIIITGNLPKLKGLRNRARIWADCEYILDRIEFHRAEKRMGDGIRVDPVAVARNYFRENPGRAGVVYPH